MFWIAAFGGLLIVSALISIKRPGIAIGLLICTYGIESFLQSQSTFFVANGRYVNLGVVLVMLVACVFSFLRNPQGLVRLNRIQTLTLLLYAFGFLSFLWTLEPGEFSRWREALPLMVLYLLMAPFLTREPRSLQDGLRWSLILGVPLMLLIAFYADWGNRGMLLARPIITLNRARYETLPLGTATLASSLAIIGLVAHLRIPMKTAFRFLVLALALYIAFRSESRGQVVAIIGVAAIVYPISNQAQNLKGLFITLIGVCLFGMIVYYMINNLELIRWRQDRVESALEGRKYMWLELLKHWGGNPGLNSLIGFGACSSFAIIGFYPHNLPVEVFVELGLIGFGIFAYILLNSAKTCFVLLTRLEQFPGLRQDVVALIGLIGVNFALCLKEGSLYSWPPLFFFLICLSQQLPLTYQAVVQKKWWRTLFLQNPSYPGGQALGQPAGRFPTPS